MKKKNELLFSVAICCLSLFVVTNLSTVAEEESSAVPYYESKPKPPMPKPQPPAMQLPVRKPGVSSIGRIKVPPPSAASNGVIYAIADNGDLLWFRHDGRGDGSFKWAASQGKKVGIGWGEFKQVFSGGDGVIYGVTTNGDLMWYRHDGRGDGSFRWAAPQGKKVGIGWNMQHVFSG
jgi:tachylectin